MAVCASSPATSSYSYDAEMPHQGEDRGHRQEDLPRRRRELHAPPPRSRSRADRAGLRRSARLHGQDPVQLQRRSDQAAGAPSGFTMHGARTCRSAAGAGFVVVICRRYHDHARPAQECPPPRVSTWTPTARSPACSKRNFVPFLPLLSFGTAGAFFVI